VVARAGSGDAGMVGPEHAPSHAGIGGETANLLIYQPAQVPVLGTFKAFTKASFVSVVNAPRRGPEHKVAETKIMPALPDLKCLTNDTGCGIFFVDTWKEMSYGNPCQNVGQ
jgi:hypothetical protein